MSALADAFLENRAEQLPLDVTDTFIVPPFFGRISIFGDKKSVRILGGRGCGKTMFIRYFCHATAFSAKRKQIDDRALDAVGLYFRPDTGFCSLMTAAWLGGEQQAKLAFSHYVTLQLLWELCIASENIEVADFSKGRLSFSDLPLSAALKTYFGGKVAKVSDLKDYIESEMVGLEMWVQNPRHSSPPTLLSFGQVLSRMASAIAASSHRLENLSLRVFVDEFENLTEMQRGVICDAIKHPSTGMIVHIAHKRDAVTDFKTSSEERISLIHDLREIDLEGELGALNTDFELLAAELVLLRLHRQGLNFECRAFDVNKLNDPKYLNDRLEKGYRSQIVGTVRSILPELTAPEIAQIVMNDEPLLRRLRDMIDKGLVFSGLSDRYRADSLIDKDKPEASVVLGALLNRKNKNPASVIDAYIKAKKSDQDPFYKIGGWVENNLYGCLFHLHAGLPRRANILYAGFDRFCRLSTPNLRFFQELCHVTLLLAYERLEAKEVPGKFRRPRNPGACGETGLGFSISRYFASRVAWREAFGDRPSVGADLRGIQPASQSERNRNQSLLNRRS
ncbi:hypothetical protein R70006_03216 [Paraburkholderia domus]|uniref:ORC-CDC6 family AAA ATPase n=1 Tax=Paraburkholderia domus TaxID=2793075 RepID=UPI00191392D7|nr:hypothetical protein [Paraburkholderia domus]MBK5050442.1 hypothetical protein [Burkholderia sp. R-70006]CAE6755015.1 hypothetical protein R70006_03216 [Paraburkholderia domus]